MTRLHRKSPSARRPRHRDLRCSVADLAGLPRHRDDVRGLPRELPLGDLAFPAEPRDQQRRLHLGPLERDPPLLEDSGRQDPRDVLAPQEGLPGGGPDLQRPFEELDDRDVEGAAAEIDDEDRLVVAGLMQAVGDGGRGRLVEDAGDVEADEAGRLDGGVPLVVVEVGGDGDDRPFDGSSEERFGVLLEGAEDEAGELDGGEGFAGELEGAVGPHVAFEDGGAAVGAGDLQFLGGAADVEPVLFVEADDGGGEDFAEGVADERGAVGGHDGGEGVGGSQVDADESGRGAGIGEGGRHARGPGGRGERWSRDIASRAEVRARSA